MKTNLCVVVRSSTPEVPCALWMGSLYDRQACSYAFWFHQRRHGVEVDSGKTTHLKLGLKVDIDYILHLAVVVRNF